MSYNQNMFEINQEHMSEALEMYRGYQQSEQFLEEIKEREDRKKEFHALLEKPFSEDTFTEVMRNLWAMRIWGNKEYAITQMLKNNGPNLETQWSYLQSSNDDPSVKYEKFNNEIKNLGPSMVTELLCYLNPSEAGIWNSVARNSISWLGKNVDIANKYKISGDEYHRFNLFLKEIASILEQEGAKNVDMLTVDYFLWEVKQSLITKKTRVDSTTIKSIDSKSRHNEIRDKLAAIGGWLGFEVATEEKVAEGSRVDTLWRARIANLGSVTYIFEVQDKGSIDSLIVNLQQAQTNSTVQKLIVATDSEQIEKIGRRVETLPESFRKAIKFWDIIDIDSTFDNLEAVNESIARLNLS